MNTAPARSKKEGNKGKLEIGKSSRTLVKVGEVEPGKVNPGFDCISQKAKAHDEHELVAIVYAGRHIGHTTKPRLDRITQLIQVEQLAPLGFLPQIGRKDSMRFDLYEFCANAPHDQLERMFLQFESVPALARLFPAEFRPKTSQRGNA